MSFTYIGDLSTNRDKVRFYIHDTTENAGPLPGGANYTDAEIDALITQASTWQRAVAVAFDALAGAWAAYSDITVGPRREALSQVAERYARLAADWRRRYGGDAAMYTAGLIRVDGYSDDVSSDEANAATEYGMGFQYVTPEV